MKGRGGWGGHRHDVGQLGPQRPALEPDQHRPGRLTSTPRAGTAAAAHTRKGSARRKRTGAASHRGGMAVDHGFQYAPGAGARLAWRVRPLSWAPPALAQLAPLTRAAARAGIVRTRVQVGTERLSSKQQRANQQH